MISVASLQASPNHCCKQDSHSATFYNVTYTLMQSIQPGIYRVIDYTVN